MHLRPGLQQQLSMQWEGGWQQVVQALLGGVGGRLRRLQQRRMMGRLGSVPVCIISCISYL